MIEHANQSLRSKSRSLAMFAAIRLASSFVSSVAAALRPGSSLTWCSSYQALKVWK